MLAMKKYITKQNIVILVVSLILVVIDLWTKSIVSNQVGYNQSIEVIPHFFWITNVHNTGAAWSLFNQLIHLLGLVSLVAFILILYYSLSRQHRMIESASLMMILAGTLGNGIDRWFLGYVRDFLSFNLFGYMFPVFNVADCLLVCGVGLYLVSLLIFGEKHD